MSYDTTNEVVQSVNMCGKNYGKVFVREWGRRLLMAEIKKPEISKAADTKTSTVTTPVVAPAAKTEPAAVKAEVKTETKTETEKAPVEKKKPGRKPGSKTTAKKPGRKPAAAKKETAKTTTAKKTTKAAKTTDTTKKTAVKESLHLEFAGKSYTTDDLVNDLKRKVGDFKSVELYVKPEESVVYYVINGDVAGNFGI